MVSLQNIKHDREKREREEAEKQRGRRGKGRKEETPQSTEESVAEKEQNLRVVKVKWTQTVERLPQPISESVQDLVYILKDLLQKIHPVQVWPGSQGYDRAFKSPQRGVNTVTAQHLLLNNTPPIQLQHC